MRIVWITTLLAVLVSVSPAATGGVLDPLTDAVRQRQETVDGSTRRGRRQYRALVAAEDRLGRESLGVGDDLRALSRCAKLLERRFRDDAEFDPLYAQALSALLVVTREDRDRLAAAAPTIDDQRALLRLSRAVDAYDRKVERASSTARASSRARKLRAGWKKLSKVERQLGLGRAPDFALADTNPSSPEFGRTLSPRDYLGKISAYYFGHST